VCCVVYDICAQRHAHKCEQFLNLYLVRFGLVFVFFLQWFSLFFCVSIDHFRFVLFELVVLCYVYYSVPS